MPAPIRHGIYSRGPDGRRFEVKAHKGLVEALLDRFPSPPPPMAALLAQRCAYKLLRAAGFEGFVLSGNVPAPGAEQVYLTLTAQIRQDIQVLSQLAKDGPPQEPVVDLQTYLASLKTQVIPPAPPAGEDTATGEGSPRPSPDLAVEDEDC